MTEGTDNGKEVVVAGRHPRNSYVSDECQAVSLFLCSNLLGHKTHGEGAEA